MMASPYGGVDIEQMRRRSLLDQMGEVPPGAAPSGPTMPAWPGQIADGGMKILRPEPAGGGPLAPPGVGIGGQPDILGQGPVTAANTPAATGTAPGQFRNKLEGFDAGKFDSGHDSPKYQFGRVMANFDPKGGITQALLDQLNALGLGTVGGKIGGDKISIGGAVDPRFDGVTEFDIIRDLETGGGWQWGGLNGPAAGGRGPGQGAPARGGMGGGMGGSPLAASLGSSDVLSKIMAEIDALAGGKGSQLTRDELLKRLGV